MVVVVVVVVVAAVVVVAVVVVAAAAAVAFELSAQRKKSARRWDRAGISMPGAEAPDFRSSRNNGNSMHRSEQHLPMHTANRAKVSKWCQSFFQAVKQHIASKNLPIADVTLSLCVSAVVTSPKSFLHQASSIVSRVRGGSMLLSTWDLLG